MVAELPKAIMIYRNFRDYLFLLLCLRSKVAGFIFIWVFVVFIFWSLNLSAEVLDGIFLYNYPNPFNSRKSTTAILIRKPSHLRDITIKIYDLFGRCVRQIENIADDVVIWDGKDDEGRYVAKGGYICVVTTSDGSISTFRKIGVIH